MNLARKSGSLGENFCHFCIYIKFCFELEQKFEWRDTNYNVTEQGSSKSVRIDQLFE